MNDLAYLRKIHGDNSYVTVFPDGFTVPWKALSVEDFLKYETLKTTDQYLQEQLEDEIFCKCVQDTYLVQSIDKLKAGTVGTVVATIMAYSGPTTSDELNIALDISRRQVQGAIYQTTGMICQAFQAYKPEEVLAMDFNTFMQRAAMAEDKLQKLGIMKEPLTFENPQQQTTAQPAPKRDLYESYQQQEKPSPTPPPKSTKTTIISKGDMVMSDSTYTGHEKADKTLREQEMVNETTAVYDDYVKQVKEGKELVIPSHEERLRAARARAKANEIAYRKTLQEKKIDNRGEMQEALKFREKERIRKARKSRR